MLTVYITKLILIQNFSFVRKFTLLECDAALRDENFLQGWVYIATTVSYDIT